MAFHLSSLRPQSSETTDRHSVPADVAARHPANSPTTTPKDASLAIARDSDTAQATPVDAEAKQRAVAPRAEEASDQHLASPPPVAASAPPEPTRPSDQAMSLVAWTPADDPKKSEQLCTVGDARECLRLAEMFTRRTKSLLDSNKAQAYRERAYSMLVLQCHQRNPDACVAIARMHALGFGLPKNPSSEEALIERARGLCKQKPATVCSAFGP